MILDYNAIFMINFTLLFLQVVILDELSISDFEVQKMKAGIITELEETLTWLAANTTMTLAALSSTSLLDKVTGEAVSQTELVEMIARTGFAATRLHNIMRSSKNIAAVSSPASARSAASFSSYNMEHSN